MFLENLYFTLGQVVAGGIVKLGQKFTPLIVVEILGRDGLLGSAEPLYDLVVEGLEVSLLAGVVEFDDL